VAALSLPSPAPAIAQGTRELRMVSTFVKNFPGLGTSANRLVLTSEHSRAHARDARDLT
jgi:hypothetical protein